MKKAMIVIGVVLLILAPVALIYAQSEKMTAIVNTINCTGCGDCVKVCPTKAIKVVNGKAIIDTEKCINCLICLKACDYKAIAASRELK